MLSFPTIHRETASPINQTVQTIPTTHPGGAYEGDCVMASDELVLQSKLKIRLFTNTTAPTTKSILKIRECLKGLLNKKAMKLVWIKRIVHFTILSKIIKKRFVIVCMNKLGFQRKLSE